MLCYMALARAIAPRPVYALADPGLDGTPMPVDLESVARCYGDVIVAHRAKLGHEGRHGLHGFGYGLFLGGWSMGGTVAQLLARTLIERGIDVRGLLLVDSNSPDRIRELTGLAETEVDAEFARRYVRSLQALVVWLLRIRRSLREIPLRRCLKYSHGRDSTWETSIIASAYSLGISPA